MEAIRNFDDLISFLEARGERKRVAVICPRDESTKKAVGMAREAGFADPVIFDNDNAIEAANQAVAEAREGKLTS